MGNRTRLTRFRLRVRHTIAPIGTCTSESDARRLATEGGLGQRLEASIEQALKLQRGRSDEMLADVARITHGRALIDWNTVPSDLRPEQLFADFLRCPLDLSANMMIYAARGCTNYGSTT